MSEKPGKDDVIKDLILFFEDALAEDPLGVGDWMVQGDWTPDDFVAAVTKLKSDIQLRD